MSRATFELDETLLKQAKDFAARTNRTMDAVVEDALREVLSRNQQRQPTMPLDLPTHGGGWVRPGINIDNSAALLDIMETADAPA